jgi:aldose sugar dehydrogenase
MRSSLPHRSPRFSRDVLCFAVLAAVLIASPARALPPGFVVEEIQSGLSWPTTLRFAPDGRLFFTELGGRVGYFPRAFITFPVTWATLPVASGGERGVLGMAIHPDFPDSPYVYVFHTNPSPLVNRVVRFKEVQGVGAEPTVLLELPATALIHNGGRIAFGPDGMIYVTFGDQDSMAAAQSITSPRGKIHRITRGGKSAPGNPWGPSNTAALMGVRNPFGLCFDPLDGTGYFTENGPECDDEVNLLALGANYGWGPNDFCGGQPPGSFPALWTFSNTIAPTGCVLYRGGGFPAYFDGNLFFGSYNDFNIHRVVFHPGRPDLVDTLETFVSLPDPVLDVTTDVYGILYASTPTRIFRIRYAPAVGVGTDGPPPAPGLSMAPNPFHDRIAFSPWGAPAGSRLDILDVQGRRVRSFAPPLPARIIWDGHAEGGSPAPAGVYLVRVSGPGYEAMGRVVRLQR